LTVLAFRIPAIVRHRRTIEMQRATTWKAKVAAPEGRRPHNFKADRINL
jgi:hypothetical protein